MIITNCLAKVISCSFILIEGDFQLLTYHILSKYLFMQTYAKMKLRHQYIGNEVMWN